ncbi:hypothetical protein GE09DRAFT_1218724 [Coniochaeta sp. 2T2.1]|nr:hypothetical protein GE09DRAFT_1218724 [Coniochaeta sp. 2T2.1]
MPPLAPHQILRYKTDWPVWKMAMKVQFEEADLMDFMFHAFEENSAIGKIALQGGGGRDDKALALILASANVARILPADQITEEPVALWGRLWLAVARIPGPAFAAADKKQRKAKVEGEIKSRQSELPRRVKRRKRATSGSSPEIMQSVEDKDEAEGEGSREITLVSTGSEENVKVGDKDMQESEMSVISVSPEEKVKMSVSPDGKIVIAVEDDEKSKTSADSTGKALMSGALQEIKMPEAKANISVLPETMVKLSVSPEGQVIIKAEAEP